jgi:hypothetical protein
VGTLRPESDDSKLIEDKLVAQMQRYLFLSFCVGQSLERVRPRLHAWAMFLRTWNVTSVPRPGSTLTSAADVLADDVMCLLLAQASLHRDTAREHWLRNKIGIRPYKD